MNVDKMWMTHVIQQVQLVASGRQRHELVLAARDALVQRGGLEHADAGEVSGNQTADGLRSERGELRVASSRQTGIAMCDAVCLYVCVYGGEGRAAGDLKAQVGL